MLADLRPRGIGEMLDAAVAIYRSRWRVMTRLVVAVVVPVQALSVLVQISTSSDSDPTGLGALSGTGVEASDRFWVQAAGTFLVLVAGSLASAFAVAAVTRVTTDAYLGNETRVGADGRPAPLASARLGPVVGLGLAGALATATGFFLCLLPGLWLQIAWCVAMPALLLENHGVGDALRRSFDLTKRRFWACLALFWLGSLLQAAVASGLALPVAWALAPLSDGNLATALGNGAAATVASVLTTPFLAASLIVLYFDLRIRSEGFDVAMLLQRLDAASAR